jgi:hypothetical protein
MRFGVSFIQAQVALPGFVYLAFPVGSQIPPPPFKNGG